MIKLIDIILEMTAGQQAKQQGLTSIGFGRYVRPDDPHKVVAKSERGKLVPVGAKTKGPPSRPKVSSLERVPMAGTMDQLRSILTTQAEEGRLDTTMVVAMWRAALRRIAAGEKEEKVILNTLRNVSAEVKAFAVASDIDRTQMGLKPAQYDITPPESGEDLPSTADLGIPRMKKQKFKPRTKQFPAVKA
ncbi:hypothetical protein LCGC14_2625360 [marine sediment metagenome]|uniref:Uncharacterized protein n=1 Tax=marine sediment metagenome TaxID=412755 RepID=A0A0F9CUB6_9ZZZZ